MGDRFLVLSSLHLLLSTPLLSLPLFSSTPLSSPLLSSPSLLFYFPSFLPHSLPFYIFPCFIIIFYFEGGSQLSSPPLERLLVCAPSYKLGWDINWALTAVLQLVFFKEPHGPFPLLLQCTDSGRYSSTSVHILWVQIIFKIWITFVVCTGLSDMSSSCRTLSCLSTDLLSPTIIRLSNAVLYIMDWTIVRSMHKYSRAFSLFKKKA